MFIYTYIHIHSLNFMCFMYLYIYNLSFNICPSPKVLYKLVRTPALDYVTEQLIYDQWGRG